MRLARLTLSNWVCYRGTQTIELGPKVYAVTASRIGNKDSSNWGGKSSLIESIDFALYGRHRYAREDLWITRGEDEGFIELETDDGMIIRRSRRRGKSTQLTVNDGSRRLAKDEAESHIVKRVGLDKEDFVNTCFFQQKKMSRFITADPGERMGIIASWLRLEPLQECETVIKERVQALSERVSKLEGEIRGKRSYIEENFREVAANRDELSPDEMVRILDANIDTKQKEIDGLKAEIEFAQDEANEQAALLSNWKQTLASAAEYERIVTNGKALRSRLDALKAEEVNAAPSNEDIDNLAEEYKRTESEIKVVFADYSRLQAEAKQKKSLAAGEFDGNCPIACIQCPARDEINAPRKRNLQLFDEAVANEKVASEAYSALREKSRRQQAAHSAAVAAQRVNDAREKQVVQLQAELESLRKIAERLLPAHKQAKEGSAPEQAIQVQAGLERLRSELTEAVTSLSYSVRVRNLITSSLQTQVDLSEKLEAVKAELIVAREALQIFGRNGAQKRVAEGALSEIENGANNLLRTCSIDLSIGIKWAREGNGLAVDCDTCGAPFPASTRIRNCSKCGAERGPKLINKLDLELSDRSGAAEDLAGIAFQLSASAWLRHDRVSAWGVAMLDEPAGALDLTNVKALTTHLATMLRGSYGFEQAFVVSHHRSTMETLAGRIEIVADGNGSKVSVV